MALVFVYGSLKRGFRNHDVIRGGQYLYDARTPPRYRLVQYDEYPALTAGMEVVHGELYRVNESLLAHLDRFEGCPTWYQRESIVLDGGTEAFAYVMAPDAVTECAAVAGGVWHER